MIEKYVNAEELKRLLGSLVVILGALMIAGLFASIVAPGLRNANKPATPTPVNPVVGEPGWLNPAEYPPARGREIPAVEPQSLMRESPELIARGKALFAQNCVQCHGELGQGNGLGASNMNPPPRNFTNPAGWTNGYDMPAIYKTLKEGVMGSSMAAFDNLSGGDRMALVHYVQSLGSFPHAAGNQEAMAALSKELATPGEKTPNKIPVSMAMAKLEGEYDAPAPLITATDDSSREAQVLRRVVVDECRAARTLAGSRLWRVGLEEMAASLIHDAPENGFSISAATLSPFEWKLLQGAIVNRVGDSGQNKKLHSLAGAKN
jgi:mono/diheme cytochrome c family protein